MNDGWNTVKHQPQSPIGSTKTTPIVIPNDTKEEDGDQIVGAGNPCWRAEGEWNIVCNIGWN